MSRRCFVALHIGAGYHSPLKEPDYRRLCTRACRIALKHLHEGRSSVDVVELVCSYLEDSPLTNAGYGSNLSINGSVECDAAIMESSSSSFGAVTCVKEVKNPIKLARVIMDQQKLPGNLVPPLVLAGEGARLKAYSSGLELVSNKLMTSPQAVSDHKRCKRVLEDNGCSQQKKRIKLDDSLTEGEKVMLEFNANEDASSVHVKAENANYYHTSVKEETSATKFTSNVSDSFTEFSKINTSVSWCEDLKIVDMPVSRSNYQDHKNQYNKNAPSRSDGAGAQFTNQNDSKLDDTIGVVCVDDQLNIASGVSSGGILLKHPGRVSHASHFGCGCWAYRYCDEFSVASCTSGCGELLIRTGLAKKAAEHCLRKTDTVLNYADFLKKKFLGSKYLEHSIGQRSCGLLLVKLLRLPHVPKDDGISKQFGCEDANDSRSTPELSNNSQSRVRTHLSGDASTSEQTLVDDLKENEMSGSESLKSNMDSSDVNSDDLEVEASCAADNCFLDLHLAHTSESFCVCYTSSEMEKPRFILSRLDKNMVGKEVLTQGFTMKL